MELKILHINDLHSRFEELARLSTIINELRDENTILLDGGDNADFMRLEAEGTKGAITPGILNEIGFDAMVFGNNEGFSGKDNGAVISKTSHFPVVTCNLYDSSGQGLDYLQDATIINKNGLRILTIGVTAPYNEFYNLLEIYAKNPREEVRRVLRDYDKSQYDILLLLSHLGIEEDKRMAEEIPGIDIIIGGHSHNVLETPVIMGDTIIYQAGSYGQYLGELIIDYDMDKKEITEFTGRIIESSRYEKDEKICKIINDYSIRANEFLGKPLYSINRGLSHSLVSENQMGNLLADALMDVLDTELGIINSGVMNKGIEKGAVSKKLLLEICPSPLNPTYVEIQGKDIIRTLEKSLLSEYYNADGKGAGFRGKHLGNIQVSNNVQVHYRDNEIVDVFISGMAIDQERWYKVGTSDYLQRGTGYRDLARSRNERYNPEHLKDTLETYLEKDEFIKKAFSKRFIKVG